MESQLSWACKHGQSIKNYCQTYTYIESS